ncbi:hypothetical protein C2E23DRAFT_918336, partial [Lenzites betulinus]
LRTFTCACCGTNSPRSNQKVLAFDDIPFNILRCPADIMAAFDDLPFPSVNDCRLPPDVLLHPDGINRNDAGELSDITTCKECHRELLKDKLPPLALANHTYLGPVPPELQELTFVEEQIIARARAKSYIVHLKEDRFDKNDQDGEDDPTGQRPNQQRGFKGHIIIHPQRPEGLDAMLPPTIDDIVTPICVIFVGAKPPTTEWLKKKAKPLCVRRERIRQALSWLHAHNPLYKDIIIDESRLEQLPEDDILPLHIEHVLPSASDEVLTDRYDAETDEEPLKYAARDISHDEVQFQKVVIADVEGRAPANELRAAAI